jgi:Flp pilus assembly protein TadD
MEALKKQFNESIQHLNHYDKNLMARLTAVEAELKTKTDSAKVVRSHETQHETQQYLLDQKQGLIKNRTNALSLIGMIHFRTRNYDQALNVLQRISEFDPENPIIHLNTGLTLIRKAETPFPPTPESRGSRRFRLKSATRLSHCLLRQSSG